MSDLPLQTPSTAAAPAQAAPQKLIKLKIALGMIPEPSGRPPYIWLERWDALIVGVILAVGVPLLGYSGFSSSTKWVIAASWFAVWSPFFVYFEGRELIGQMIGRGAIKQEQLSEQQDTAQDPFYGVIAAGVIWLVVYVVHVTINVYPQYDGVVWRLVLVTMPAQFYQSWWDSWIAFGIVEWFILLHAWLVTKYVNYIMYNTGNTFSKAAPMGERTERRSAN